MEAPPKSNGERDILTARSASPNHPAMGLQRYSWPMAASYYPEAFSPLAVTVFDW
jgi:hypothetical protein